MTFIGIFSPTSHAGIHVVGKLGLGVIENTRKVNIYLIGNLVRVYYVDVKSGPFVLVNTAPPWAKMIDREWSVVTTRVLD